jgi:hypothetical protein
MTEEGWRFPPFIVVEKGESLDEWQSRIQPDFPTIVQVLHLCKSDLLRPCCGAVAAAPRQCWVVCCGCVCCVLCSRCSGCMRSRMATGMCRC